MSMKMSELIAEIEVIAPRELEEEWDNCGMQINMGNDEISRVLVALEITKSIIAEATMKGVDFIITHHPLLFNKIDVVDNNDIIGNYVIDLIRAGISVYTAHTTFDEAFGGNNEYLAEIIGLTRVRRILNKKPYIKEQDLAHPVGRIGDFSEPITMDAVCRLVEKALKITGELRIVGDSNKIIRTVGLCTGAGGDMLTYAIKNGCDLFITGDVKHHEAQLARESGICLIDAGHYGTEYIFAANFADKLRKNIGSEIQILESEIVSNPFSNMI
ncbi:MAG: Nif3-like dinuclear metal center hexameric protein [Eubacteriales bacterium]|nr:Nif3-like dinuclear metal center hexameric protein [Eubacteriales bacterium]MDD3198979.1 Nif3-like dinuclear metal center hexameric protein [Eubacteriales bacterium]MDD4122023.1 Nif3-like dinuclear metal center hexameric protein [Eubacteriales bacterium]MDD4629535.1 Nif3-like dinuclear metal center hexameric protein [Eubacteriales bacterium]